MRARDFILEYKTTPYQGIDMVFKDLGDDMIQIEAQSNGRELGYVTFVQDDGYLLPQDLHVDERYRGQGIAAVMYDYAKSQGYKIRRSGQQTDAGRGFWDKHKPGQNVWEQELDEVQILSKVKGKGSEPGQLPKFGREISPGQEQRYLGQQVGKMPGYTIWRDWFGGQLSYHLFDPEQRRVVITTFGSRYKGNLHSYIIHGLYASPGNTVKAHQFYHALVLQLGLTLISDRKQSPGGNRVWQKLETYPDIEVYGYDTKTGETLNIGAGDEEMYSVPSHAATGREMSKIARDIRLVATAR